ncbi:MAG: integrase core domain-containing protein [Streptosporangiaceae bacterium]
MAVPNRPGFVSAASCPPRRLPDQAAPSSHRTAATAQRGGLAPPSISSASRRTATSCRNKFLIRDRGSNFTASFDAVFQAVGTRVLRTAVQAPRMNAICERLVGTLRRELLDRMLILGETHLRATLAKYQVHYNTARPHQGIAQRVPVGEYDGALLTVADLGRERIHRRAVLGGLINEYSRAA